MTTTLYLIRHGATAANLERPYRLQGRGANGPLAPEGVRQAEHTRDLLSRRRFDRIYASPLHRAVQTANIIAEPHRQFVTTVDALTECDVGRWENQSWDVIEQSDAEVLARFLDDPANQGYPEGESFGDVHARVAPAIDALLQEHDGQTILVVGHHVVNRVYLAGILGLTPGQARRIKLDNCGISVVVREQEQIHVATMNATFHLQAAA